MLPVYKDCKNNLEIFHKKSSHVSPHLHKSAEFIYVTDGSLELGVGQELYHMDTHDFGIVFPELIHHYQVFDSRPCKAIYLLASPALCGSYQPALQQFCPRYPVIKADAVHPDIPYALNRLSETAYEKETDVLQHSYTQIILARAMPHFSFTEKSSVGSNDMIYRTVAYIAGHFTEEITLSGMAKALGYSPCALSGVFSKTFHTNFNGYLNDVRLDYVCHLLRHTNQSITEAYENAGFSSQRTFNRVFQERFRMTPREYRRLNQAAPSGEHTVSLPGQ